MVSRTVRQGANASPPAGRTGRLGLASRRAAHQPDLLVFYLSIVACLVIWVIVVRLLVGWSPMGVTTGSMRRPSPGDIVMSGAPGRRRMTEVGTVITFRTPTPMVS